LKVNQGLGLRFILKSQKEENISRILFDINNSKNFLDPSPRVMEIKPKINKWDLIKLTSLSTAKP